MPPETKYVQNGNVWIAYQVVGDGPMDLVFAEGLLTNLELMRDVPIVARVYERLASFSRLILFDPRGCGQSDRGQPTDSLEERMDDMRAVLDATGSRQAALLGFSLASPLSLLFAATYPERATALVNYAAFARLREDLTFMGRKPWTPDQIIDDIERGWGGPIGWDSIAPSLARHPGWRQQWARYIRLTTSRSAFIAQFRLAMSVDLTPALPAIRVPTLVLHCTGDRGIDVEHGRELAQLISGAKYVELAGDDEAWWIGDGAAIFDEVEEFLTGIRSAPKSERVLATVMFTDIVGSTERAAAMGDKAWRTLLDRHYKKARHILGEYRGREVKTTGDGMLATFDGPARAIRCAMAIRDSAGAADLSVRAGLHTAEIERVGVDVGGIGVHVASRVADSAGRDEVLVSRTVVDLVAGSGIDFEDRGEHTLKGVPGDWRLFAPTDG